MTSSARAHRNPLTLLRTVSPDLKRLVIVGLIESAAVNAYATVIAPWAKQMGYGADTLGTLTALLQIVSAIVSVGSGFVADWLGRKRMYTIGQLFRCAVPLILLTMHNYVGLVVVFVVRGLCGIQFPAQQGIFAAHTQKDNRATMIGVTQSLSQLASVLVPVSIGVLADRFGVQLPFVIAIVLCAASVMVAIPLREKPEADPVPTAEASAAQSTAAAQNGQPRESFAVKVRSMFSHGRALPLTLLLLAGVANGLANGGTNILLPYTVMDRFSSGYTVVSALGSFSAFGSMIAQLFGGRMADLRGRKSLIMSSGILFPVLMTGILFTRSVWEFGILVMLVSMIGNVSSPAIGAVYMEAVPDENRSTFAGLNMGISSASMAIGSAFGGRLYTTNSQLAWTLIIIAFALQAGFYYFALPADRRARATAASVAE